RDGAGFPSRFLL
ncbi:hypothetical protein EC60172_1521B, partial [Escherichia coli 6.0172]